MNSHIYLDNDAEWIYQHIKIIFRNNIVLGYNIDNFNKRIVINTQEQSIPIDCSKLVKGMFSKILHKINY
jgi:hypothetical protein